MALFEQKSSIYQDDYVIKERMEEDYRNYNSANQAFQAEANLDLQYYAGDQAVWNQYFGRDTYQGQRQFVFNLIKRVVEMPGGYQRQHRKSTTAIPVENGDQRTADQMSKIFSWVERNSGMLDTISDAFTYGTLITGLNLVEIYVDYSNDPVSGDIKFDRVAHNSIMMDPYFKKMDLSDCNSIWKRSFVTNQQAAALLPDYRKEIMEMRGSETREGKFQYMPENFNFDVTKLLSYDEYYYMDTREQKLIVDKETGDQKEWNGKEDMLRYMLSQDQSLTLVDTIVPTVKQAIVLNGRLFYSGGNLLGLDQYPFAPFMGYYSPDLSDYQWRMQGIVRALRDPQYLFNRRQVISLDALESIPTSGWTATEGSVIDPESLYKTGQGVVIWKKKGSAPEDLTRIQPSDISPGMAKMTEDMSSLIQQISGVNEEMLGAAEDDIPGVLSMMRQGAGLITLQRLFNNADSAQKLLGQLTMKVIQNNFTPGKVQRIIEEEPTEEFYNQNFGKYDVAIEEGFNTSTQRQQQFAQLLQLKQLGIPIPDETMIEACTLQNKNKLIETLQQQAQAAQEQQQAQAQMQMQEQAATIEMAKARAQADQGMAVERLSRVNENEQLAVERKAEAEKDREQALLNKAKTMKELQEIDLKQIEQILKLAKMLQVDEEVVEEETVDNDLISRLSQLNRNTFDAAQPPASGLQ